MNPNSILHRCSTPIGLFVVLIAILYTSVKAILFVKFKSNFIISHDAAALQDGGHSNTDTSQHPTVSYIFDGLN